jgi:hypothetical protein
MNRFDKLLIKSFNDIQNSHVKIEFENGIKIQAFYVPYFYDIDKETNSREMQRQIHCYEAEDENGDEIELNFTEYRWLGKFIL